MATSIIVKGKRKSTPGVYTKVDASQLNARGPGPIGVVALIGTAEGGMPVTSSTHPDDFIRLTSADQVLSTFRSGDLREAAMIAFNPANDELVPSGAAEIYCMKVNQALQSSASVPDSSGCETLTLTSVDYGEFTNQINYTIASGLDITTVLGATSEPLNDVGNEDAFSLLYTEPVTNGGGWESMTAQVLSTGVRAIGTRTDVGLSTEITTLVLSTPGDTLNVAVANAGDYGVGKQLKIWGLNASNAVQVDTIALTGASVNSTTTWNAVYGGALYNSAGALTSAAGNITVTAPNGGGADDSVFQITVGAAPRAKGVTFVSMLVASGDTPTLQLDAGTWNVILVGTSTAGATINELEALDATGMPVYSKTTASNWRSIDAIVLGGVNVANTLTIKAVAVNAPVTTYTTLQSVVDHFNSKTGFTATMITGETEMSPVDLDYTTTDVGSNIDGVTATFTADLNALISEWNDSSELVTVERTAFTGTSQTVTFTAAINQTYTLTFPGGASYVVQYTADGSATTTEIAAGLATNLNYHPLLRYYVSASASSGTLTLTALTPAGFGGLVAGSATGGGAVILGAVTAGEGYGTLPATTSATFLTGGSEGATPGTTEWTNAINRLKQIRVNHVVPLTGNSAYHALIKTFCVNQDGVNEASAFVGISGTGDGDLPTKTELKTAIRNLNSKFVQVCGQSIDRFNTSGVRETFMPWFQAAQLAGVRAGSPLGLPSTHKYVDCLSFTQDSTWNPVDDSDELIQAGCVFYETVPNVGIRIVRDITSYLKDDNLAYIEGAVVHEVNLFAYEFRRAMEWIVGRPGFPGTVTSAVTAAKGFCLEKVRDGSITDFETPTATLSGDRLAIAVAILPTLPINFVPTTIYLRAAEFTA